MKHPTPRDAVWFSAAVRLAQLVGLSLCLCLAPQRVQAQTCSLTTGSYSERFITTTYLDPNSSAAGWASRSGSISLSTRAGGFVSASAANQFGERVIATVAADFNQDGRGDIMVLSDTPSCHLDLFTQDVLGNFNLVSTIDSACGGTTAPVMATGDADGDGRPDLILATTSSLDAGLVSRATLYRNTGSSGGITSFAKIDLSAMFAADAIAWHIGGTQLAFADITGDGRQDLLVLTSAGSSSSVLYYPSSNTASIYSGPGNVLLAAAGLALPIASAGNTATGGYACMPSLGVSRGGTVLAAADFDGDGRVDLMTGSVSEAAIHYFRQNSDGSFQRLADVPFAIGGPLLGYARDIDLNGAPDLVLFRSGNDCGGTTGEGWVLYNDGQGNFNINQSRVSYGHTVDFAAVLDYGLGTVRTLDLLAGRVNGIGNYDVYNNQLSATGLDNLRSTATSLPVTSLDPNLYGVVSLTVTAFAATTPATPTATSLTLQVTNDNGLNWETLTASELAGTPHSFSHFGSSLRWRAVMTGTATNLSGTDTNYAPATKTSPSVSNLAFTYGVVSQQFYSRSGLESAQFTNATSVKRDLLLAASFQYPGFQGKLFAYDLSTLAAGGAASGTLQQVDNVLPLLWEAGSILKGRSGPGRTLYGGFPLSSTLKPQIVTSGRLVINSGEISTGSTVPTLASMMGVASHTVVDRQNLVAFLNGGMGDITGWKLKDPGHASPVFIGAPVGNANYLGNNYGLFSAARAGRAPTVLLGANDGMLHAFDADSGSERWGWVPYNLLNRFAAQRALDANGVASYVHQPSMDASPTVADVYANGAWHTVAVGGQGQGLGLGNNGYYYAVDVTDPTNPQPLWEFSDIWSSPRPSCALNSNCVTTCTPTCSTNSSTCQPQCSAYDSLFTVNTSTTGYIEAEHFDGALTGSPSSRAWQVQPGPLQSFIKSTFTISSPQTGSSGIYNYIKASNVPGVCSGNTATAMQSCALVTYRFRVDVAGTYYPWFRTWYDTASESPFAWGVDGAYMELLTPGDTAGNWFWQAGGQSMNLPVGEHTLSVWMYTANTKLDMIAIQTSKSQDPFASSKKIITNTAAETCASVCDQMCTASCTNQCYSSPSAAEWPQCGVGAGLQCCGTSGSDQYCAPTGSCTTPESVQGQTLSQPSIGRLNTTTGDLWVAFFASGYNSRSAPNVGRSVYAVNAYTGALVAKWDLGSIPTSLPGSSSNPVTLDNTIPGGVALADVDGNGYVDHAYVGDLDGRLWKFNTSKVVALGGSGTVSVADYPSCVLFDAGDPEQTGSTRNWAPIITKPAVAVLNPNVANIYFGTGGDDRAPDTILYKFYSIQDMDPFAGCGATPRKESSLGIANLEWVVGDGLTNTNPKAALINPSDEGTVGDRFWADPTIVGGTSIYFASLPGKIESVNPCVDNSGQSKVYGYALVNLQDASGVSHLPGQSLFGNAWLQAYGKVRRPALTRGGNPSGPTVSQPAASSRAKTDVFIQSFTGNGAGGSPTIQRLTDGGTVVKARLRVLRWREVTL